MEPSESSPPEDAPPPTAVEGRSCTRSGASFFIGTFSLAVPSAAAPVNVVPIPTRLGRDGGPLSGELAKRETVGAKPAECGGDGGFCKANKKRINNHSSSSDDNNINYNTTINNINLAVIAVLDREGAD